ncbi:MAG: FecR domain-containing protein [Candidatus Gracilibacteria bacterium]
MLQEKKDEASLTLNSGTAEVLEWGQTDWNTVSDAQVLLVGDTIKTGEGGFVTLSFYDGTEVRVAGNTEVLFKDAVSLDNSPEVVTLTLISGKVFMKTTPNGSSNTELVIDTEVSKVKSASGSANSKYLVYNGEDQEYVYNFGDILTVDFVDRSEDEALIQSLSVKENEQILLTSEERDALIARMSMVSVSSLIIDSTSDEFLRWNLGGSAPIPVVDESDVSDETVAEDVDDSVEVVELVDATADVVEDTTDDSVAVPGTFQIKVDSPSLQSTIQKDAIAIEGSILAGEASIVTITWDGNNQPYTLGGFAPGDANFRYVADIDYGNFKIGSNTYTVTAYDADGKASNTVTVVVNYDGVQ